MFDIQQLDLVRGWAVNAHGDQRYGDAPYIVHLDAVHQTAVLFGITDPIVLAGAYLHDVLEDTPTSREELGALFGGEVAEVVWAVTNEQLAPDGTPLRDRKQRGVWTYPKIAPRPRARLLKLSDRIANVRASRDSSPRMLAKYRAEHPYFKAGIRPVKPPGIEGRMWTRLDALLGG